MYFAAVLAVGFRLSAIAITIPNDVSHRNNDQMKRAFLIEDFHYWSSILNMIVFIPQVTFFLDLYTVIKITDAAIKN